MKININFLFGCLLGLAFLFPSCYKDLGNYTYHPLNTISIQFDSAKYNVVIGQTLSITPRLSFSMDSVADSYDTTKYGYEWLIRDTSTGLNKSMVIAQTRNLNMPITLQQAVSGPASIYELYYYVTDKRTGIQTVAKVSLAITTNIYEGWLALCDMGGSSRLDMAICSKGVYSNQLFTDVLGLVGSGLNLSGSPMDVSYCYRGSYLVPNMNSCIYISTTNGTNRIDGNTFLWTPATTIQADFTATLPAGFYADKVIGTYSYMNYLHTPDGNLYAFDYTQPSVKWAAPINMVQGETSTFPCSPYIDDDVQSYAQYGGALLFDTKAKRFLFYSDSYSYNLNQLFCTPVTTKGALFDFQHNDMDLAYMEQVSAYNKGQAFAVMLDSTGAYWLAEITNGMGTVTFAQNYFAPINATNIGPGSLFAVNPDYGYVFYTSGSQVYEYDPGLKQSFLMQDYGSKAITVLQFHHFESSNYSTPATGYQKLSDQLVVATYDPSQASNGGQIDQWAVPALNGPLQLKSSITGFGKIHSLTYRER